MNIIDVEIFTLLEILMKVMFPKHIQKGFFAGVAFSIAGFSISFIQLIILAIGVVFALGIFSSFSNSDAKGVGVVFAVIIFLIFAFIAFFKQSELNLLAFIAKKIKDFFWDTPERFQVNYTKISPIETTIAKAKQEKGKQRIEIKEELDVSKLNEIEKGGIL